MKTAVRTRRDGPAAPSSWRTGRAPGRDGRGGAWCRWQGIDFTVDGREPVSAEEYYRIGLHCWNSAEHRGAAVFFPETAASAGHGDADELLGHVAYVQGHYAKAVPRPRRGTGSPRAAHYLASLYHRGCPEAGIARSLDEAARRYRAEAAPAAPGPRGRAAARRPRRTGCRRRRPGATPASASGARVRPGKAGPAGGAGSGPMRPLAVRSRSVGRQAPRSRRSSAFRTASRTRRRTRRTGRPARPPAARPAPTPRSRTPPGAATPTRPRPREERYRATVPARSAPDRTARPARHRPNSAAALSWQTARSHASLRPAARRDHRAWP